MPECMIIRCIQTNLLKWRAAVRKLPGIPRELPKYIDRVTYPEEMLEILFRKYYAGSPLLPSELDA
jgi:hypothetical protein